MTVGELLYQLFVSLVVLVKFVAKIALVLGFRLALQRGIFLVIV